MTRKEWMELADEYEARSNSAYSHGDEIEAEHMAVKAQSCRYAACYGTEEEQPEQRQLCPYCHGTDLDMDGDSGGGCTHCINGYTK